MEEVAELKLVYRQQLKLSPYTLNRGKQFNPQRN